MCCPSCGDTALTPLGSTRYNTGVYSEDGYCERVEGDFALCEGCGATFDIGPRYRAGLDFELELQKSLELLVAPTAQPRRIK